MAKSKAVALMRAGEKARKADQRVTEAQKALAKAERARDKADEVYMSMVRASIAAQPAASVAGQEGAAAQASA